MKRWIKKLWAAIIREEIPSYKGAIHGSTYRHVRIPGRYTKRERESRFQIRYLGRSGSERKNPHKIA